MRFALVVIPMVVSLQDGYAARTHPAAERMSPALAAVFPVPAPTAALSDPGLRTLLAGVDPSTLPQDRRVPQTAHPQNNSQGPARSGAGTLPPLTPGVYNCGSGNAGTFGRTSSSDYGGRRERLEIDGTNYAYWHDNDRKVQRGTYATDAAGKVTFLTGGMLGRKAEWEAYDRNPSVAKLWIGSTPCYRSTP